MEANITEAVNGRRIGKNSEKNEKVAGCESILVELVEYREQKLIAVLHKILVDFLVNGNNIP